MFSVLSVKIVLWCVLCRPFLDEIFFLKSGAFKDLLTRGNKFALLFGINEKQKTNKFLNLEYLRVDVFHRDLKHVKDVLLGSKVIPQWRVIMPFRGRC